MTFVGKKDEGKIVFFRCYIHVLRFTIFEGNILIINGNIQVYKYIVYMHITTLLCMTS